jgi:Phosphotransferase system cellobiose-specific component IIA
MDKDKKIVNKAMEILLHAGESRNMIFEAFNDISLFEFDKAKKLLSDAQKEIVLAHKVQTCVLQDIASEICPEEYSILFTHAQDTLMTIYSEYNIAMKIINITEKLNEKINRIEENANV